MGVSLLQTYNGDADKVCEHYARMLERNNRLKEKDVDEFIEWMKTKTEYFPRLGICADPNLYAQAFYIQKKLHDDKQEQQHLVIVGGKVGKGKTTVASQLCTLIDPTYCLERVCYLPHQFFKVVTSLKPGQAVHIDEGGNFFKALNTSTKASKYLGQYFQMARAKRLLIVINYDDYEKMNKEIREKADSIIYKIPNPNKTGVDKYASYWYYKGSAVQAINNYFNNKKKLPLTHHEMTKYISYRGNNNKDYPIINDLDEEAFKGNKMKYVQVFEKIMLEEFDDLVTAAEKKGVQESQEKKYLMRKDIVNQLGISDSILERIRKNHPEAYIKIGNCFRYDPDKIIEIGENV